MSKERLEMAIDLLWVKHNKVGGVESYIRNLLDSFLNSNKKYYIYLILSLDNYDSFSKYGDDPRFELVKCNVYSENVGKRIIWQNLHLGKLLKKLNVYLCFEPHNYIPVFGVKKVNFVTTIHDLQLLHYPENFSKKKIMWFKFNWQNTLKNSRAVVVISDFVKNDLNNYFPGYFDKIHRIYNPININENDIEDFSKIKAEYGIEEKNYYFTVSSLMPHKNLMTLIKVFAKINKESINLPKTLVISGVGGTMENELRKVIAQYNLQNKIILTGFISNSRRNSLYKNCCSFLFASVFEGFGMPPIEALMLGTSVITTKESCLPEVTENKCNYVDDPYNVDGWIKIMSKTLNKDYYKKVVFDKYDPENIFNEYYRLFQNMFFEVRK